MCGKVMKTRLCKACLNQIDEDSPSGLCRACLHELSGSPSEAILYSGTYEFFHENGSGFACPCCGSELTMSDISSRACALCGDLVSLEVLRKQADELVAGWKQSA